MEKKLHPIKILFFIFLLLAAFLSPHDLMAQESQPSPPSVVYDLFFSKVLWHMNQKRYPEAIQELNQALLTRPGDVEASYFLGVALSRVGRDEEAEGLLEEVIKLDPQFKKVHFGLGIAKYNLQKYQEALRELELAEADEPDKALIYYYQGLSFHHLGEYERSSPRFLRAIAIAPELGLTAHYYAGVGFYRRGILDQAQEELQEALRIDPTSPVGRSAQEFLAQIKKLRKKAKPWDFSLNTVYQYDSNVILLPGGSPLPTGISQKGDHRLVVYAKGGYQMIQTSRWSIGGGYAFYQNLHNELTEFNVQNHEGNASIQYQQGRMQAQIPYKFGYALVDEEVFLRSHSITPTLTLREASITYTQLQYGYEFKDFVNTPQFSKPISSSNNDDRDGVNHLAQVAQSVMLAEAGLFRIGYRYDRDLTGDTPEQDDWEYQGHQVSGDLRLSTLEGLRLDLKADYYIQYYRHPNTFSGGKRRDDIQTYSVTLSKTAGKWVNLTGQYMFNRNDSNIPVFNYDRHIFSVVVAGVF